MMTDWADDLADSLFDRNSRDYTHYPDRESIAAALRKAKADGLRDAANHYDTAHPYEHKTLGSIMSPFARALYNTADKIERGE